MSWQRLQQWWPQSATYIHRLREVLSANNHSWDSCSVWSLLSTVYLSFTSVVFCICRIFQLYPLLKVGRPCRGRFVDPIYLPSVLYDIVHLSISEILSSLAALLKLLSKFKTITLLYHSIFTFYIVSEMVNDLDQYKYSIVWFVSKMKTI